MCVCMFVVHWPLGTVCNQITVDSNRILCFQPFESTFKNEVWTDVWVFYQFLSNIFSSYKCACFITSLETNPEFGNLKEEKVTKWHFLVQLTGFLSLHKPQHLRVETSDFNIPQGHDQRKSCEMQEHPVLNVNSHGRGFSSSWWKNNLSYRFVQEVSLTGGQW